MDHYIRKRPPEIVDKYPKKFKILNRQAASQNVNVVFKAYIVKLWRGEPKPEIFGLKISE
jgi:hypothetical protein